eukprot:gnl/MRDRNA2_/MRDRNA2_221777_c0_seq1.p1 gnl/MRDRNA2_/MRDRNA2_221777_c0~~gnl/MRDRNA2_/MRDRNA2_221777_c0_seq1.p1  ORF type:complete len:178 (-),score=31.61 gnl/MRDRNA2_/MRDRNA2_221777_c0_seq1:80-613(-)
MCPVFLPLMSYSSRTVSWNNGLDAPRNEVAFSLDSCSKEQCSQYHCLATGETEAKVMVDQLKKNGPSLFEDRGSEDKIKDNMCTQAGCLGLPYAVGEMAAISLPWLPNAFDVSVLRYGFVMHQIAYLAGKAAMAEKDEMLKQQPVALSHLQTGYEQECCKSNPLTSCGGSYGRDSCD